MGADDVAFRADPEEFALDGVAVISWVDWLGEDRIERIGKPLARSLAVDGTILRAVGNPNVGDAGSSECLPDRGADAAASDPMVRSKTGGSPFLDESTLDRRPPGGGQSTSG